MQSIFPLSDRISAFIRLGNRLSELEGDEKQALFQQAQNQNAWFTPQSLEQALKGIMVLLDAGALEKWVTNYSFSETDQPQQIGLMLAGNIPGVGFHDILAVLIAGHSACIKLSSQDSALPLWLLTQLKAIEPRFSDRIHLEELLKNKQAYIATGSNNSSRYFDYYFGKFPNIIRRNRTSVAIIDGTETAAELDLLADDIQTYFGLGCRNVTQLFVPTNYDFIPLLTALKKYEYYLDFHKYKHNYDYHLALLIMGNKYYMNNDSLVFAENESPFSPVSQVHYQFYSAPEGLSHLTQNTDIQCIVGNGFIPFGSAQTPSLTDYADGTDTMAFLQAL